MKECPRRTGDEPALTDLPGQGRGDGVLPTGAKAGRSIESVMVVTPFSLLFWNLSACREIVKKLFFVDTPPGSGRLCREGQSIGIFMGKHLNRYAPSKTRGFMPDDVVRQLIKLDKISEYVQKAPIEDRDRILAFLTTFNTIDSVAKLSGFSYGTVLKATQKHRDIIQAATLGRNMTIAGLAEQRAIELLMNIDTNAIPHDKKPQAIKYLVDSADIANQHNVSRSEKEQDDTMELVFRIKRRLAPARREEKQAEAIEGEFTEVKPAEGGA
jgi:hypothetical protein